MEKQSSKLGIPTFVFIIISSIEMPNYLKYPLATVALISLVVGIHHYHKEIKAKISNKKARLKG